MSNVLIELVVSFAQYLTTIVNIPEVNFPDSWKKPIEYVATINIGLNTFASWFPALSDIRVYFMFLSVVGPLVFVVAGLLFLNEKRIVLWYLMVVMGVMVLLAGALGRIVAATTDLSITADTSQLMLYVGIADLVVMAVIFLIYQRCTKQDSDTVERRAKVMEEETKSISIFSTLQAFCIFAAAGVFAALCWGVPVDYVQNRLDLVAPTFARGLSGGAAVVCLIFFVWFIMGLSQAGRKKQWEWQSAFESGFLRIFLLTMSLSYIPIGGGVFLMFNCNVFSCPTGYRLPDDGSVVVSNSTALTSNDYCVTCQPGPNQMCPATLLNSICAGSSGNRLEYAIETQCENIRSFFWPAAGLIIVMFVLGVPIMFYFLIEATSSVLAKEFPIKEIKPPDNDPDFDMEVARWKKQLSQSQNVAKFLFQPFQFRFRFVRLFQIIQKLLIVGTTSYVIRNGFESPQMIALACSVSIHCLSFILLAYFRPFAVVFEARIAIIMSLSLTVSCVISILLALGVEIPSVVMYVIIAINGALPCMAIGIGLYLEWTSGKQDDEAEEKEKMMRLSQEMDKKLEEEQKQEMEAMAALQAASGGVPSVATGTGDQVSNYVAPLDASMSLNRTTGLLGLPPPRETAEERRRRQLRRLRLRQEAKMKVKDDIEKEALRLNDAQQDVDLHIDRLVKSKLQMFLMIGGVIGAVALSLCVLGLITRQDSGVIEPFPTSSSTATQLASYSSWSSFVSSCCCTTNNNTAYGSQYVLVEKWICANGYIKERVRSRILGNSTVDGFNVRGFCNVTFASDCSVAVDSNSVVALSCNQTRNWTDLALW